METFLTSCSKDLLMPMKHNRIGGVMVSQFASIVVDREFESRSGQTKDYKIDICCFSTKHAALRIKSKCWFSRNQDNVSEWNDISSRGLFFSMSYFYKNPTNHVGLVQSELHQHLIEK